MSGAGAVVLVVCGIVCLAISGVLLYRMIPRAGQTLPPASEGDFRETSFALTQFILMIAGVALLIKGLV
jgi:hypothetical protein